MLYDVEHIYKFHVTFKLILKPLNMWVLDLTIKLNVFFGITFSKTEQPP